MREVKVQTEEQNPVAKTYLELIRLKEVYKTPSFEMTSKTNKSEQKYLKW